MAQAPWPTRPPSRPYTPDDLPCLAAEVPKPAAYPRYVIPGSHWYDNGVYAQSLPPFPFPRTPWPYETETRAAGTGLLWGCPSGPPVAAPAGQQQAARRKVIPMPMRRRAR